MPSLRARLVNSAHDKLFRSVHGHRLIYNTCWEDPRIDRQLLHLDAASEVVMITSAGCNALDYLLDDPARIHCVDMNPRQNAVLELKRALFVRGIYEDLFAMFGIGYHPEHHEVYAEVRAQLPAEAQSFWDRKIDYFDHSKLRRSFYYRGAAGDAAWLFRHIILPVRREVRRNLSALLNAETLEEQREVYMRIEPKLWNAVSRWLVKHPVTMALLGVPRPQMDLIDRQYPGGLGNYVRDKLRHVFTELPTRDNYFWRVYVFGCYSPECLPNYLRRDNFHRLQGRMERLDLYTGTLSGFLQSHPGQYSHFVLLDHQDWLAYHHPEALREEWELIFANSRPGTRILMRSAGWDVSFLPADVAARLRFHPELTEPLHHLDRVGTYGSCHLAEVP